jgi:putative nucleotidyltransferase with HDIG domain
LLAKMLKADIKIVETAAYLHDIGRAEKRADFVPENDHHIAGAGLTRKILTELGYDEAFISKVEHCVLAHRGRKGPEPETVEAKIVNCADAMAHFDTFLDLFHFFLQGESFEDAILKIERKMQRDWEKKLSLPEAKELVREKYEAIMLLIGAMKGYM